MNDGYLRKSRLSAGMPSLACSSHQHFVNNHGGFKKITQYGAIRWDMLLKQAETGNWEPLPDAKG